MSIFAQALAKQETAPTKTKSKGTTWTVRTDDRVGVAVKEMVRLEVERKALDARTKVHKGVVKKHCDTLYISNYADAGVPPETPLTLQNEDGDSVTFVVQDRSGQYKIAKDQMEALDSLLGADAVQDLVHTKVDFGLSSVILSVPGVQEVLGKAIEKAMTKLVTDGVLTAEQAGGLLTVDQKTALKPQTLDRLATICGRDTVKMERFLDIVGSNVTRYPKP